MNNPYSVYSSVQAQTAPPGTLVVMLYQGAIRFIRSAIEAMEHHDIEGAHHGLVRAQDILAELRTTLDRSAGPIAERLDAIYVYLGQRLAEANVKKDPAFAQEALNLLTDLLPAWTEASRRVQAAQVSERPNLPSKLLRVAG